MKAGVAAQGWAAPVLGAQTVAGQDLKVCDFLRRQCRSAWRPADDGLGQGMLALLLQAAGQLQQLLRRDSRVPGKDPSPEARRR